MTSTDAIGILVIALVWLRNRATKSLADARGTVYTIADRPPTF